ncbi:MAG: Wadjet anti-phage system protein JetD domain-containing protein [Spirochaetota bacterium]
MSDKRTPSLSSTALAVLAEFADSFPVSAHYRGGRKLRKGDWERVFPDTEHDVEAKEDFLDAVDELVALGVVSVKWKRFRDGSEVDALYLEDADRLHELIGRPSPEVLRDRMIEVLRSESWTHQADLSLAARERLAAVRERLLAMIESRHPVGVADAPALADLASVLRIDQETARRVPIRALSVRLFNDSKRLERLLPLADRVTRSVFGVAHSEETGLARSYPEVSFALRGSLVLSGAREWSCRGEVVTLPAATVGDVDSVRVEPSPAARPSVGQPRILSVENKETFHVLSSLLREGREPESIAAVTYCGGHPHAAYVALLERFRASGPALYHFGDLDPDGLLIFAELQAGLDVELHPYFMDVATLRSHLVFGYAPPQSRMALLRSSLAGLPPQIRELATEILAQGRGVEQEVIDVTRAPGT